MQTDLNTFSSVANNERVLLLSRYSTNCSLTELLELQSPMVAEIQSETVSILSFLNGAIQRPLSYEQHIMNQKLTCAKKKFEKSCLLAYREFCGMELKRNLLVKQYCNDEMILCSKLHDQLGCHNCKPSNENHSTFDYDVKKTCETNIVFDGLQDLRCIMAPDYYPDGSQYMFPTPILSCDSVNEEDVRLLLSLRH